MENKRCSYFFLTINKNANCYNEFEDIIKDLSLQYDYLQYSYIYHTKKEIDDVDEENHIHCVLYFRGAVRSFNTIQNIFKGAHIELTNQQRYKRCIQYLIHKNNKDKTQYLSSDIHHNITVVEFNEIISSYGYDFELFDSSKIEEYLISCLSSTKPNIFYFIDRFGLCAIRNYYFIICDLLKHKYDYLKYLQDTINDTFVTDSGLLI